MAKVYDEHSDIVTALEYAANVLETHGPRYGASNPSYAALAKELTASPALLARLKPGQRKTVVCALLLTSGALATMNPEAAARLGSSPTATKLNRRRDPAYYPGSLLGF
jgi:hypothetical protein